MAPQAKLFLVVSTLCTSQQCDTDPTWQAVQLAGYLVSQNGGGVVSMSFGDAEILRKPALISTSPPRESSTLQPPGTGDLA